MEVTKESIEDLLNSLVKPMFDGIVEIEVDSLSLFDDPNLTQLYPTISIIYDKEKYMEGFLKGWASHNYELEDKVTKEVQLTLKYFNIHHSIVDAYVMSD
jgi:hypothetical protein